MERGQVLLQNGSEWNGDKFCGRCGCPYRDGFRCPECRCPEFSLVPDVLHEGWKRRVAAEPLFEDLS